MTWNRSFTEEVRNRTTMNKVAFGKVIGKVIRLLTASIQISFGKSSAKCFTWNVVMYGSKTRTTKKKNTGKVFGKFRDVVMEKNRESTMVSKNRKRCLLERIGQERILMTMLKKRKKSRIRRIFRRKWLQRGITGGKRMEKRKR